MPKKRDGMEYEQSPKRPVGRPKGSKSKRASKPRHTRSKSFSISGFLSSLKKG